MTRHELKIKCLEMIIENNGKASSTAPERPVREAQVLYDFLIEENK